MLLSPRTCAQASDANSTALNARYQAKLALEKAGLLHNDTKAALYNLVKLINLTLDEVTQSKTSVDDIREVRAVSSFPKLPSRRSACSSMQRYAAARRSRSTVMCSASPRCRTAVAKADRRAAGHFVPPLPFPSFPPHTKWGRRVACLDGPMASCFSCETMAAGGVRPTGGSGRGSSRARCHRLVLSTRRMPVLVCGRAAAAGDDRRGRVSRRTGKGSRAAR